MAEFVTIGELLAFAKERIASPMGDILLSGTGESLARNRRAFERLVIEQQILIGYDEVDITTEFLGIRLPSPVIVCPMGSMFQVHTEGDLEMARGVGRDGSMLAVARMAGWPLEEVAAAASGPLLYQFYCEGRLSEADRRQEIARVEGCPQYKAMIVTVDAPVKGRVSHIVEARGVDDRSHYPGPVSSGHRFAWPDLDRLRADVHLPMGMKGILNATDASRAIEHGMDFVWVSSRSAGHLDANRPSIDVLDEVVGTVAGRVPIIVDGGFRSGTDVIKGIAKGADLVAVGRLAACALGVGGADAVTTMLQMLQADIGLALAMSGRTTLAQLGPEVVRRID